MRRPLPGIEAHFGADYTVFQARTFVTAAPRPASMRRSRSEPDLKSRLHEQDRDPRDRGELARQLRASLAALVPAGRPAPDRGSKRPALIYTDDLKFRDDESRTEDSTAPTEALDADSTLDTLSIRSPLQPRETEPKKKRKRRSALKGTRRVFVGGLSSKCTDEDLYDAFAYYGCIARAEVLRDPGSMRSRGFGYVTFMGEIPSGVLGRPHLVGGRMCGVRDYRNT